MPRTPTGAGARTPTGADPNADIWKSAEHIDYWVATADERERRRGHHRRLLAALLPFAEDEEFTFVDLGAGTGAAARAILDHYGASSAILADFSPQMMEEGRRALAAYGGRYTYVEIDLAAGRWPKAIPHDAAAIVSSLCVHHLPDEGKQALFRGVIEHLAPAAWYFNYNPVITDDPVIEEAWQRAGDRLDPEAAAKRASRTPEEQSRYENHVRHMSPLDLQLGLLRAAGFEAVDVYWKELDHVIYGGRRPEPREG